MAVCADCTQFQMSITVTRIVRRTPYVMPFTAIIFQDWETDEVYEHSTF